MFAAIFDFIAAHAAIIAPLAVASFAAAIIDGVRSR